MPRRERELFGPWLIRQINSNIFEGVRWLDEGRTLFRLPWKHLNIKSLDERDYGIFKAWAICSRKYNPHCEDPPTWKTNFRCALNQVHYHKIKMFSESEDRSSDQRDPHKIYKFNGIHEDLPPSKPNAATCNTSPSNLEAEQSLLNDLNDDDYALRISPDCVLDGPFIRSEEAEVIEELMRNVLLDSTEVSCIQQVLNLSEDDYPQGNPHVDRVFRQSTHEQWESSQVLSSCVPGLGEQCTQYPMCNVYQFGYPQNVFQQMSAVPQCQPPPTIQNGLALHELQVIQHNGYQQKSPQDIIVSNIIHNGFQQDVSGVDRVIKPSPVRQDPPLLNGPRQAFVQETRDTPLNQLAGTHDGSYKTANNGCPQDKPRVDQGINSSTQYSYHTTNEECASSSPAGHNIPLVNGSEQASASDTQATLLNQQRGMPPITSWEVSIYYRGKEVLKKNISKNVLITSEVDNARMEDTDIVQFPSTDVLADHLLIKYTTDILSSVEKGLLIEVNPQTYKVYATRMSKARVFWSLSESVETTDTDSEAKKLIRDVPTEIFDYNQFWEELKAFKQHRRSSPDYTIYMAFAQILLEPVMKKFVVVKEAPQQEKYRRLLAAMPISKLSSQVAAPKKDPLVPNLCTYLHQATQQSGASSLHSEVISLQISNGNSFNSFDLNDPCLMDIDFQDLL